MNWEDGVNRVDVVNGVNAVKWDEVGELDQWDKSGKWVELGE